MTICCTFNGDGLDLVGEAVGQCINAGGTVLSPVDPTPAEFIDNFWYVASDHYRDPALVERRHLDAVAASDLIWLIAPDGYIGFSAGTEIAFAAGRAAPAHTADRIAPPAIAALAQYAHDPRDAMRRVASIPSYNAGTPLLLDPDRAGHEAATALDTLRTMLLHPAAEHRAASVLATKVRSAVSGL